VQASLDLVNSVGMRFGVMGAWILQIHVKQLAQMLSIATRPMQPMLNSWESKHPFGQSPFGIGSLASDGHQLAYVNTLGTT